MTFKHGKATHVYVAAVERTAWLNSLDVGVDLDTADSTVYGATWKTAIPGTLAGTLALAGYYDPDVSQFADLATAATVGTVVTACPGGGTAIGDPARMLAVTESSYQESSPVGGLVAFTAGFTATGPVGLGHVLHPLGEDTNTTYGVARDDGAGTTTGWTAHLHVIAVDGGSWVIKITDSADGTFTDSSDVVTFTAATGATSQRLVSATPDAALRRHVVYSATRTGGAAGNGITFLLAYARN